MKTVAYNSPFVPAEWLAAHGVRPRRIQPAPHPAGPAAGPFMGLCPFARALIGTVASDGTADASVFTTTCDQMRRAAEWVGLKTDRPVFLMNVPATWQTPAAPKLYRDELRRLGRFLVRLGGAAPSHETLGATMDAYDARRHVLCGALGTLSARQAAEAIAAFDLDWQPPPGPADRPAPHAVPVALVGGPMMRGDGRVFDTIERAGGVVVLDATESGRRTLPAPFDRRRLRDDPVMELVDAYFGTIPDAFRRPDTALQEYLARELAASEARGVILWRWVWCDLWAAQAARLRETTGLPVLDLDLSDEDPLGRAAGRIQAFLEILQ